MMKTFDLNTWILRGLHAMLALSIPLVLIAMIGCMKAKEQKEDLGPEVPASKINDALGKVSDSATLDTLAVGQYIKFVETRRIENGDSTVLLGQRLVDVIDRQDTTDEAHFTVRIQNATRLLDGKYETTVSEEALWLTKVSSAITAQSLKPVGGQKITAESLVHSRDTTVDEPQKVTFHHFRESDEVIPASETMKAKADCAGLNPCELPVHIIQFDMVIWASDTDYQKISFDFAFSLKTPMIPFGRDFDQYSGLLVADCRSTYIPLESRTVYVRDCLTLDDFKK